LRWDLRRDEVKIHFKCTVGQPHEFLLNLQNDEDFSAVRKTGTKDAFLHMQAESTGVGKMERRNTVICGRIAEGV
jgi:hypothetical protein